MKVPLSWLREYVDFDDDVNGLAEKLTFSGIEVEGIERIREGLESVIVGEVVDDLDAAAAELEASVGGDSIVWITDSKGDRHGIVSARLAFIEVESTSDRAVGFGL